MSSFTTKKQDLPPSGGYKAIKFGRIPAKNYFNGTQIIGSYVGVTVAGLFIYYLTAKKIKREEIEMRSAENCIYPLLVAERDREFLKQLRKNRDEESRLMANIKDWEVGTWYGEPIFKTLPEDELISPSFKEFYAHAEYKSYAKRANLKLWS
ncbi:NADH dehydrogenase [ubiquinone] 1 alpha subcomplex subunit 13 [Condylostylus longicornis]|uniref:NADH dehydrogenase [ubiquinone] 1 alpha subcomplex subunit 13 n=1 Tax=Condylostylus longicornis TaxID=2530218 RepID=UPI00244DE8D4|nr:NADH dehydrogenase [ubiquinone] 1 alpha subcomplex subunit 13 [Condylostylus longicornis]